MTDQNSAQEEREGEHSGEDAEAPEPHDLGIRHVTRFHLDVGDETNTIDLAPPFPFSC